MSRRGLVYRLMLAAALVGAIVFLVLHREYFETHVLQRELSRFGNWAPLFFVLAYALAAVLFVPGVAFTLAGGALFGPLWGTIWNLVGATCGASLAFLSARYLVSGWVAKKSGKRLSNIMRGVEAEGWRFVAFVRLVPLFPFNLLNYALGLTRIRFATYVLASAVCMVPAVIAYTWLGYAGRQAATGGANLTRDVLIAVGVLAAAALLPSLVRRFRGKPRFIEAAELRQQLGRAPKPVIIDVRTPDEFAGPFGHIPGARNVPLNDLAGALQGSDDMKSIPTVVVCLSDQRAAKGAALLREAGFERVSILRGGMQNWKQLGYPIELPESAAVDHLRREG
jgi:uncharacterized membrane protein YdjX (TVP38/TMEM64 family)/rhodanese-related sulfurtransferase